MGTLSDKQLANLAKGRVRGIKRKNPTSPRGTSWADLIREYGETPSDIDPNKTWKAVVVASAYRQAALGNAAILRELMQRSEPQDIGVVVKQMTDEQLKQFIAERIRATSNSGR